MTAFFPAVTTQSCSDCKDYNPVTVFYYISCFRRWYRYYELLVWMRGVFCISMYVCFLACCLISIISPCSLDFV